MRKQWWHDKVAYQIYPKSFYDSNGDGIGDIQGIISKLDYLKSLGIDIVWISPIYQSPLADQGYDISDYYSIDPRFGTMEDMEQLIQEAKKREIYILMDLVVNHCSDEHEWFKKAIEDPDGKYGNFFYIEDAAKRPSNWRSYFGGSVWEPLPKNPDKQYLHFFHKKQPDLNWENPEVREEVYKNINWWLDKGLGGFRIDAIINIKKKLPYKDYPSNREDGLSDLGFMLDEAEGIGEFLNEMNERTFLPHNAFSVGEVFNAKPDRIEEFIGENGYFNTMFDFSETEYGKSEEGWYACKQFLTPEEYKKCIFSTQRNIGEKGMFSNIIENHDQPRGVSHYINPKDLCDDTKKMLGGVNFMLRGLPFIYQGQEIGMENTVFSNISEIDDVSTLDQYQVALDAGLNEDEALKAVAHFSRDNTRTPMHWNNNIHAGFTTGTPWLQVNSNYRTINVENQEHNQESILNFYRKLIALRKNSEYKDTIVYGKLIPYREDECDLIAFERLGEKKILVLANFSREEKEIIIIDEVKNILLSNQKIVNYSDNKIILNGYQFLIVELS